jgi:hypothetical protein
MDSMKKRKHVTIISLMVLGMVSMGSLKAQPVAMPKYVAGKIVSVSHEKVTVNNIVLDKITVGVDNCSARGSIVTVNYLPATVSDRTALGHLFEQNILSARTANMEKQQRPNGFGLFWVDENNRVLRTGILGEMVDCNMVPQLARQFH